MQEIPGCINSSMIGKVIRGKVYAALIDRRQLQTTSHRNDQAAYK